MPGYIPTIEIHESFEQALLHTAEAAFLEHGIEAQQQLVHIAYTGGGAWARYFLTDHNGNVLATCSDQCSSFIPVPTTIQELQDFFRTCNVECHLTHQPGSHHAFCNAWVTDPLQLTDLLHPRHLHPLTKPKQLTGQQ